MFADDPGQIPASLQEIDPTSMREVNGHAIWGDGSDRGADFTKVSLADLGHSLASLSRQDGQLKDAIAKMLETGEAVPINLTGVRAGGGFEGRTGLAQQTAIGRFSVSVSGYIRPNGNGQWFLDGRVRGEVDRQDYPDDSRRTGIGPAGNTLGQRLQGYAGGNDYNIYFYGSQRILMALWP